MRARSLILTVAALVSVAAHAQAQRPARQRGAPHVVRVPHPEVMTSSASPPPAEDPTIATARALYNEATQLLAADQTEQALDRLQRVYAMRPNATVLIAIATTQERLGRIAEAIATLERAQSASSGAPAADLAVRIAELRARPATTQIASTPAGARVSIDGHDAGQLTPAEISMPPGHHTVSIERDDFAPHVSEIDLAPGGRARISAQLSPLAPVALAAPVTLEVPANPCGASALACVPPSAPSRPSRVALYSAVGIGVGSALVGAAFGAMTLIVHDEYDHNPRLETYAHGTDSAVVSDVAFGVAVLGGLIALVLYLTEPNAGPAPTAAPPAVPVFSRRVPARVRITAEGLWF